MSEEELNLFAIDDENHNVYLFVEGEGLEHYKNYMPRMEWYKISYYDLQRQNKELQDKLDKASKVIQQHLDIAYAEEEVYINIAFFEEVQSIIESGSDKDE